jgi:Zn-dependent protease with chaperone function
MNHTLLIRKDTVSADMLWLMPLIFIIVFFAAMPVFADEGEDSGQANPEEDDYIVQIEDEFGLVDDPAMLERVGNIETRLLDVVPKDELDDRKIVYKILNEDIVNAFALPDGHIYLFKGMLDACETDDMLAGVMAHELTHVLHGHHSRMGERQLRGMLIGIAATIATGDAQALMLGQMLAASMVETYGRNAENDADRTGTTWTVEAGYDPVGYLELMQILEQEAIHQPEPGGNYFTIHPNPDERMANIREALSEQGIEIPADIYRVHLALRFYLPLDATEAATLESWENAIAQRAEGPDHSQPDDNEETIPEDEIPPAVLTEYRLRRDLFSEIQLPSSGVCGVVAVGTSTEAGVFYLAEGTEDALHARADDIILKLGDKFMSGLRNYQVQARTIGGSPAIIADMRVIAYTTDADAMLQGLSAQDANNMRKERLKDILYRYFVDRRI